VAYRVYNTSAFVIDSWPYREASRRFYLYTKKLGRVLARAKSVRKISAKLQGGLQVGAKTDVELVCGKSGWRVVGVTPETHYLLGELGPRRRQVFQLLRLFARLVPKRQKNVRIFYLLSAGLASASSRKKPVIYQMIVYFLLVELGYGNGDITARILREDNQNPFRPPTIKRFQTVQSAAVSHINTTLKQMQQ
jgi:recombinational DNA repair protein (RecF pathway)